MEPVINCVTGKWSGYINDGYNGCFERMFQVKTYSQEEFKKMKALKREFVETGEGELFTKNTVKRRLRIGEEKATQLFNDLTKQEDGE